MNLTAGTYETLPDNVKAILDQSQGEMDYNLCAKQVAQLNTIGWSAEYGLDGEINSIYKL